jgi:peptide-methionine (S)-S-oxide reductase
MIGGRSIVSPLIIRATNSIRSQPTTRTTNQNCRTTIKLPTIKEIITGSHAKSKSNINMSTAADACAAAAPSAGAIESTVALGAGCYWGTEKFVKKDFQKRFPDSVKSASVGFMSPDPNAVKNPSYRAVCSGSTGHVEVLNVELNDPEKHYEELIKFFFMFHDPSTKNRQGNDVGTQYASAIFTNGQEQARIAEKVKAELQELVDAKKVTRYANDKVETEIFAANPFYEAHAEHQEYLMKNPGGYCNHFYRFKEWPELN